MADKDRELDELRAEAIDRGIAFDGRWGAERLREALANTEPDDEEQGEPEEESAGESEAEEVLRAGGYVNRGDGHGWVIDNKEA